LEYALKSRTHEKIGWLKQKLLEYDQLEGNEEALWKLMISDYKCPLSAVEGMRLALGVNFEDSCEYKGVSGIEGKFLSQKKTVSEIYQKTCGQSRAYYMHMT
jgi:hypothetical protein